MLVINVHTRCFMYMDKRNNIYSYQGSNWNPVLCCITGYI